MSKRILVVNDRADLGQSYGRPFKKHGEVTHDLAVIDNEPDSIKLAVFTGGEDVDPAFYGHKKSRRTWSNPNRDTFEKKVFDKLKEKGIPLFGICRGSQFLCAMAGGKLCQHLDNHGGYHDIETNEGETVKVNSTHHQMQLPPEGAEVIAWAAPARSRQYVGENDQQIYPEKEFEVVYYPNIKALGVQYHPEAMSEDSEGWEYYQRLIRKFS